MHAIAYVSSASWEMTRADLDVLFEASRQRNEAGGITGVLLYCDGNFMQYLEGPEPSVRATYERILASERHRQVNEMFNQAIVVREYGEFSLGFARGQDSQFAALTDADWRNDETLGPGALMLQGFWSNCRTPGGL